MELPPVMIAMMGKFCKGGEKSCPEQPYDKIRAGSAKGFVTGTPAGSLEAAFRFSGYRQRKSCRMMQQLFLLCKSFRKASASGAKHRDLQHFVGDAAGSMPVCMRLSSELTKPTRLNRRLLRSLL